MSSLLALIPARAGSKRIRDKNVRRLGGHPTLAYAISSALESGVCDAVVVSTDSAEYAAIARHYGAEVPVLRPSALAGDVSPDIDWVEHMLGVLRGLGREYDCFTILRPTSPFRQAATIRRAWHAFQSEIGIDSLRAVEKCSQHPGKMWILGGGRMTPLLLGPASQPWHSSQYASLPHVYVQNGSLEIAWTRVVFDGRSIAGRVVMPFMTTGYEGFDLNSELDWRVAEEFVRSREAGLPRISRPAGEAFRDTASDPVRLVRHSRS